MANTTLAKYRQFVPALILTIGFLCSFLPFTAVDVSGPADIVAAAQQNLPPSTNVWGDKHAGLVLLIGFGIVGLFGVALAVFKFKRFLTVPLAVVAAFFTFIGSTMIKGYTSTKNLDGGVIVTSSAGPGMWLMITAFLALAIVGLYGTIKPDQAPTVA